MRRRSMALLAVLGAAASLVFLGAGPASAHEIRTVGKYQFTVGFGNEPAYLDQENFVQFFLHDLKTGKPITTLGDSLKVDVVVGSQKKTLALLPSFDPDTGLGTPGEYDASFFPTAVGKYTFHFYGSIGGQKIDQSFTSGPTTFALVEDPSSVQFPNKVPTTADLNSLVQHLAPRVDSVGTTLAAQKSDLQSSIDTARLIGIIGLVVGAAGLIVAVVALARRRRVVAQ
jgi:hypothetical protein